jgi:hypothetical protein
MDEVLKCVRDQYYQELEQEEGITKADLTLVDLSIAFSPVIQFKGSRPVEVTETIGGNYIVHGELPQTVDAEMLKVMRYRYLSNRTNPFR